MEGFWHLGKPRKQVRGLTQGCALSCMLFNVAMTPLLHYANHLQIPSTLSAHADDLYLLARNVAQATTLCRIVKVFLDILKVPLQPSKTQTLSPCPSGGTSILVDDVTLEPASEIVVLGQSLQTHLVVTGSKAFLQRQRVFFQRTARIGAHPSANDGPGHSQLLPVASPTTDFCLWVCARSCPSSVAHHPEAP